MIKYYFFKNQEQKSQLIFFETI